MTTNTIDPLSVSSLLVESRVGSVALATATGFVVKQNDRPYLITNWHVVSGRDPNTTKPLSPTAALPDQLVIMHHVTGQLGSWQVRVEELMDKGKPRWLEHPTGHSVDVVALPLQKVDSQTQLYPLDLALAAADILIEVAMPVSIVGFPFGLTTGGALPIWKTGHIASEPNVDYHAKPAFVVDATTRGGMSGSPVFIRTFGSHRDKAGNYHLAGGTASRFLGVYSGRIHEHAELGIVWRPECIDATLKGGA